MTTTNLPAEDDFAHYFNATARLSTQLRPAVRALRLIATGCATYTDTWTCRTDPARSPYAKYTADRWCDPCIAQAGLDGTLPEETR
jgi:hypothetical protein